MEYFRLIMHGMLFFLMLLTLSPGITFAQMEMAADEDTLRTYQIDEIISSGTRTRTKVIDIPYSVQRVSNYEYKYDKKVSISDVLGGTPGLFMQSRYGNHDVRISIRGFGSRSNTGIRGVRILQDGIPESEPDGQTRIESIDFQNVGAIEIVKGNASSLYTNAPGGVINFISDLNFTRSHVTQFNEFGSFGLSSNGFKAAVKTDQYRFLATYNYHSARGFREHSQDYWHIFNSAVETQPSELSRLTLIGYYVSGLIRLPGSLTRARYDEDPFQPNTRDVGRDAKRITQKGRLGIRFETALDEDRKNEVEVTGYGTMKYFHRTAATYRVFNRNGIGGSARFTNRTELAGHKNEFSLGGDLFYQSGPIEEYNNLSGKKGDLLVELTDETISNAGFYVQNSFGIINDRMNLLLTGRYDNVVFISNNQLLEVRNARRVFGKFTPKAALNYKLTPRIALYTSYGLGFDTPAGNELGNFPLSAKPEVMLNPDLEPQRSKNFELGIKGSHSVDDLDFFRRMFFEVTFFNTKIDDEVIPFELEGDVYFRNAARTNRTGLEVGADAELLYGLRLKAAYTYSNFTYSEYIARNIVLNQQGDFVIQDSRFSGNVVPSVPKHNISLALSYTRVLHDNITGFLKTHLMSISGMYVDDLNSDKTTGYQLLNVSGGVDFVFDRFNLLISGGINNVSDKRYVAFININSTRKEFYEAGEPRTYFGGITLGFTM
ncbi:MAG: TonB-dependent receptor [Bacteroidetes bacterium]|nr:TonB-dependent receptor [Bacteroidota bacterium]MCW5894317.1 TonB-dependent receptor [Bacteroidota bacterium]